MAEDPPCFRSLALAVPALRIVIVAVSRSTTDSWYVEFAEVLAIRSTAIGECDVFEDLIVLDDEYGVCSAAERFTDYPVLWKPVPCPWPRCNDDDNLAATVAGLKARFLVERMPRVSTAH